jgi:hypothetical protein
MLQQWKKYWSETKCCSEKIDTEKKEQSDKVDYSLFSTKERLEHKIQIIDKLIQHIQQQQNRKYFKDQLSIKEQTDGGNTDTSHVEGIEDFTKIIDYLSLNNRCMAWLNHKISYLGWNSNQTTYNVPEISHNTFEVLENTLQVYEILLKQTRAVVIDEIKYSTA